MLTTSAEYKTAISASSRQIKSRCAIAYTYPFIHAKISSVASSTEHADSDRAKVVEGLGLGDYYNAGKYRGFKNNAASDANAAYATNACYLQVNYIANEILTRMELVGDLQGEITVENLVVNGGFEDGLTGWTYVDTTPTVTLGIAAFTASARYGKMRKVETFIVGHKYVFIARVKSSRTDVIVANDWGNAGHSGSGDFETLSFIGTADATSMHIDIVDYNSSAWTEIEIDYVMAIDITDEIGTDYFLNLKYKALDYFSMPQTVQVYETPVDYTIKYMNASDTAVAITTVTNNYGLKKINAVSTALTTIRKARLDVTKWSRASVSAKISGFSPRTVVNYDGNQIMTVEVNEEIETEQGSILGTAIAKRCDIVFNNIEGDFDGVNAISNRVMYPEIGAVLADGTVEYEPMGTYYTEAWDFSDDKLTLSVAGLDILGYINSLRDVSAFPSGAPYYNAKASEMIATLIARANCGYLVVVNNEGDLGTVTLFGSLDTITFGNVSLRQVLTWVAELAMGFVSSPYRYATGYTQTSRFKNTVDMTYRFADLVSFTASKTITADNYFKIKTILERTISANTYYIDAVDGDQYLSVNTARQATEGVVSQVVCQGNPIVAIGSIEGATIQFAMDYIVQNQGDRIRLEWQGDPSLDLCDFTQIQSIDGLTGYNGYLVSNQIKFDGGLRQISTFKTLETEAL